MLEVNANIQIPDDQLRFTFSRSGGPGGQNVNKVNSKATLHWDVSASDALPDEIRERFTKRYANRINNQGEIVIHSQRTRDQEKNVADCLEKLREMIVRATEKPKKRKPTRPSRAAKERRLKEKKSQSDKKRLRGKPKLE